MNQLMKTKVNQNDNDNDNDNDVTINDETCSKDTVAVSTFVLAKNRKYITRENVKVLSSVCQRVTGKRFSQFKTLA